MIQLNLTEDAVKSYAEFYSWSEDSDQTAEEFVTAKLIEKIQNDLVEKRNRDAITHANEAPLPQITEGVS